VSRDGPLMLFPQESHQSPQLTRVRRGENIFSCLRKVRILRNCYVEAVPEIKPLSTR
jgi:hypothetical protein